MELDPRICYRALRTRDARFDGRFFTGVTSTGVFCRPVCPAPTPKAENCRFYACAAAALDAGFRPCLRCRPETSPGTPAWIGTSGTVSRALRLISEGALDEGSVDELAARLGVGERHLRRLFLAHLGTSPLSVAQTQRVLFAKKLIDETDLPLTTVALSAGFASVRRFNDAMRATYQRTPSDLRRVPARRQEPGHDLELKLAYRPPLHWDALIGFLAARAIPGVEMVGPDFYRRTLSIDGRHGIVEVRSVREHNYLMARVRLPEARALAAVVARLRRIFDLGADPEPIAAHLGADPRLAPAVAKLAGLRVPGAWDGFELAVRAILGQQVSVRAATTLAGRIAAQFGEPLQLETADVRQGTTTAATRAAAAAAKRTRSAANGSAPTELRCVFPTPAVLARADLTAVGLTRARAAAICALAAAVERGDVVLDASSSLEDSLASLRALPGIGEWTAHYIAMRALREPDAFPAADLGLRRALANGTRLASPAQVARAAEAWRPWRAYAAILLWTTGGSREAAGG